MRGRDQADIHLVRVVAAEPLELLLLQDPQQFRLKFQRDVAYLIKKERALVRKLKTSRFLRDRPGKCSLFVAEQLTLQKTQGDSGAVQFRKSPFPAAAQIVDCTRDKFFTCSRLAEDQHARIRRCHYGDQV